MSSANPTHSARDAALDALGWDSGPLLLGGTPARELVDRFGSPLYVHDADVFAAQIARVRAAFGDDVDVLFALKANPLAALSRIASQAGCGGEVASAGELAVARLAGMPGPTLQFAGPGKSDTDLAAALDDAVGVINLESPREHDRLAALAGERGLRPRVAIRVNPGVAQGGSRLRTADRSSRFGVDRDAVSDFARSIADHGTCELVGLHVYAGSQSFDAAAWVATATALLELAAEVESHLGFALERLNFGGGFGWPVYDSDPSFDLRAAGDGLCSARANGLPRGAAIELGRYLAAPGGVYLTTVRDLKRSGGRLHAVLDGGMHHHGAAAGFGAVVRRCYALANTDDPVPARTEPVDLGGPLCTPADRLGRAVRLAPLAVGDVVAVLNSGAYGLTHSPVGFLGHRQPAELVVARNREPIVARDRGRTDDAIAGQHAE